MSATRAPSVLARRSWLLSELPRVSTSQRTPLRAEVARQNEGHAHRRVAERRDDRVDRARGRLELARDEQPLEARGEADGRAPWGRPGPATMPS